MNKEWHIPGGKMEEGETPEQALVREIKEETGIDVGIREMIEEVERPEKDLKVMWYLCKPLSFDINPGDDISDARFVSKSEIKDHCGHNAVSLWPPKVVEFLEKVT